MRAACERNYHHSNWTKRRPSTGGLKSSKVTAALAQTTGARQIGTKSPERTLIGMDECSISVDDVDLWSMVVAGDGRAFATVFDKYRDQVYRFCLRVLRSTADAEDATAIVFMEAWRARARVRIVNGSAVGWLLVTANNVTRNYLRSRARYERLLRRISPTEPSPDPGDEVWSAIAAPLRDAGVRTAFHRLKHRDQQILALCVVAELSTAEVAELLHVPLGTVKSRLSRAKQSFADAVGREDELRGVFSEGAS